MREKICDAVSQIGLVLDRQTNKAAVAKEAEISTRDSEVKVFVIPTNEQVAIANDTYELTKGQPTNCDKSEHIGNRHA
jgi:acetate kinase